MSQPDSPVKAPADVKPRPAATVVLLRDGPDGIETFMVVRHHEIDFASGALVFPGGKVDEGDAGAAWSRLATGPADAPGLPFRVASVRETYEEAGFVLARRAGEENLLGARDAHRIVEQHRAAMAKGETEFADIVAREGLQIATDLLVHFAHWVTPVGMPKRFDTHFFLVAAPVEQLGAHDGDESVEGLWISPRQALEEAKAGKRTLVPATRMNLMKLSRYANVAEAVDTTRASKVVMVLPRVEQLPDGRKVHIPAEAGYGVSEYFVPKGQSASELRGRGRQPT